MMSTLVIILCSVASIILGRALLGRWLNHLSLYAGIWGGSLLLFEARLIYYYPLGQETWFLIAVGWLAFLIGSITPPLGQAWIPVRRSSIFSDYAVSDPQWAIDTGILSRLFWILNIISMVAVIQYWYIVVTKFGSVFNVLLFANYLYSFRVAEGLPGSIPYLPSFALAGTFLSGVQTAARGRLGLAGIIPLVSVVLLEIASMGRAKLIMAGVLFVAGYILSKQRVIQNISRKENHRLRQVIGFSLAIALLVGSAEFVRSTRGANENLPSASNMLKKFSGITFITPTIYLYVTVNHGVFDQYLKEDDEHTPWGSNTFASAYRVLAKLGFETSVPIYQRGYKTPIRANTGTFLRELHADFGIAGIIIVPYVLGFLASWFWQRFHAERRYFDLAVYVHLLVIVAMSLFYMATRSGDMLLSFLISTLSCAWLDQTSHPPGTSIVRDMR